MSATIRYFYGVQFGVFLCICALFTGHLTVCNPLPIKHTAHTPGHYKHTRMSKHAHHRQQQGWGSCVCKPWSILYHKGWTLGYLCKHAHQGKYRFPNILDTQTVFVCLYSSGVTPCLNQRVYYTSDRVCVCVVLVSHW